MNNEKTLIHHDGALGDVLLSLPCLRAIHDVSSSVHFAGRGDVGRLLRDTGLVQERSSADGALYCCLYSDSPDEKAAAFLMGFCKAFVFTAKSDSLLAANMRRFIPDTKTILTIADAKDRIHVGEYRFRQLNMQDAPQTGLIIPDQFRKSAIRLLQSGGSDQRQKIIAIHPGSGGKKKCWPIKNYLDLIAKIRNHPETFIVILTGPAEDSGMKKEIREFSAGHADVMHIESEDLTTVAALLSLSALYIGNDSGISHLAAAVGAPSLALFGATDPVLWRPMGKQVHVLSSEDYPSRLEDITVGEVYGKAGKMLWAQP